MIRTFCALLPILALAPAFAQLQYPATPKGTQVDIYHGVKVADPYRWLEDDRSPQTAEWVQAENKLSSAYLAGIPYSAKLFDRLKAVYNYPKYGLPFRRGQYYFYTKNNGLQNQPVWYVQKGLDGTADVLIDPNELSKDGTVRLGTFSVSRDGNHVAYSLSQGGSDWLEAHVLDVASRKPLTDNVRWIKVSGLSWAGDGFFYSRYPAPAAGQELTSRNEDHTVYYHPIGTPQDKDELVYSDPAHPQRFNNVAVTTDERFAVLAVSERGKGKDGNALYFRDLRKPGKEFIPIVGDITDDHFFLVNNVGSKLLIRTNQHAPNERIALYDPVSRSWTDLIPERSEPIQSARTGGGKIFVTYAKDVATRVYVYNLEGKLENEVALPGLGSAAGFAGNDDDPVIFYSYTSFNYPTTTFRYDVATRRSTVFRSPDIPGFAPDSYEVKQVFFKSKDGTRIPMFLVYRKGLELTGRNPTIVTGYGGFNVKEMPSFNSPRLALLEQGFVYASVNLRGGGEYGDAWHRAGMKLNKQNVFDDCIAAAEWLIANKYTSPEKLAIQGASNGGLLVGAVINQRPDLFRAAVAHAGVMDMLRFQKFTIGWNWIADYGSSDNPDEFKALYAYSPLHNIREDGRYPAVLITTADHDDRVIPGHSFKYAAALQEKASKGNPVLIRIATQSGHAASSTTKLLEEIAEVDAFLFKTLGVTPKL